MWGAHNTDVGCIWSPEQLKRINDDPALVSLLYDLNLLPEVVLAHIRHAREEERERCAAIVLDETKNGHWSSQHLLRNGLAKEIRGTSGSDRTK